MSHPHRRVYAQTRVVNPHRGGAAGDGTHNVVSGPAPPIGNNKRHLNMDANSLQALIHLSHEQFSALEGIK